MKIEPQLVIDACANSQTMAEAHRKLGVLKFDTFVKYAKQLGVYKPNPGRAGIQRTNESYKNALHYIENKLPISSHSLKNKLIRDGAKKHECEMCKNSIWNGKLIPIELDHINGDHFDNALDNLRIICPNCHAQTDTHAGKKNKGR